MTVDVRPFCFIERSVPGGNLLSAVFFGMAHAEIVVRGDGVAEGVESEPRLQGVWACAIERGQAQARGQEPLAQILQANGVGFRPPGLGTLAQTLQSLAINHTEAGGAIAETILSRLQCGRRRIADQEAELGGKSQQRMGDGSHA